MNLNVIIEKPIIRTLSYLLSILLVAGSIVLPLSKGKTPDFGNFIILIITLGYLLSDYIVYSRKLSNIKKPSKPLEDILDQ